MVKFFSGYEPLQDAIFSGDQVIDPDTSQRKKEPKTVTETSRDKYSSDQSKEMVSKYFTSAPQLNLESVDLGWFVPALNIFTAN